MRTLRSAACSGVPRSNKASKRPLAPRRAPSQMARWLRAPSTAFSAFNLTVATQPDSREFHSQLLGHVGGRSCGPEPFEQYATTRSSRGTRHREEQPPDARHLLQTPRCKLRHAPCMCGLVHQVGQDAVARGATKRCNPSRKLDRSEACRSVRQAASLRRCGNWGHM
jgi:hypothetical protein